MTMSSTVAPTQTRALNMLRNVEINEAVKAELNLDMSAPFTPQAQDFLRSLGDPRGFKKVALVGQAVAAILLLPALEMLGGLPTVIFKGFGADMPQVEVDLADFRHQAIRNRRGDLN